MELVRGETLEEMVRRAGRSARAKRRSSASSLCRALAAVHSAGLLHRDVKAQNVMREDGGRIVLMDFGAGEDSRARSRAGRHAALPRARNLRGQQASSRRATSTASACCCSTSSPELSGHGGTMEQLGRRTQPPARPLRDLRPDVPEGFVRAVERALDSDPARRYRSIGELEQGLRESLDRVPARAETAAASVPTSASLRTAVYTPPPWRWRCSSSL